MRRLLLYFSYIGTNYKGLQLQSRLKDSQARVIPELRSVQGILEHGLRKILQCNSITVINSSRTDAGVHALSSTVQFDVDENWFTKVPYSPEKICQSLNLFLDKNETDIRAQRILEVAPNFFCRRAHSRNYLYRVAVAKNNDFENCPSFLRLSASLPITELNRCQLVPQPFDVLAVQKACRLFVGTWDFRSFMKTTKRDGKDVEDDVFVKTIYKFSFSKCEIEDTFFNQHYLLEDSNGKFDLYEFNIQGSGFLRRQVRRMVGALFGVARGSIDSQDILWMLQNPLEKNWNPKCTAANSEGLYLKSVNYKSLNVLRGYLP